MGIRDAISACAYVCVREGRKRGKSVSPQPFLKIIPLLESMFVIAVKVWRTLILVLP